MNKVLLIYTGVTKHPTREIYDELSSVHGSDNVDCHVFTWAGMNSEEFEETFCFATIHQYDYSQYQHQIATAVEHFTYNAPETNPSNTISMFRLWALASEFISSLPEADTIKVRVDNSVYSDGFTGNYTNSHKNLRIPLGGNYRNGIGDHICMGPKSCVETYLQVFNRIEEYAGKGVVLHPESLLHFHLLNSGISNVERTKMIVMCRGAIYNTDYDEHTEHHIHTEDLLPNNTSRLEYGSQKKCYACRGKFSVSMRLERLRCRLEKKWRKRFLRLKTIFLSASPTAR